MDLMEDAQKMSKPCVICGEDDMAGWEMMDHWEDDHGLKHNLSSYSNQFDQLPLDRWNAALRAYDESTTVNNGPSQPQPTPANPSRPRQSTPANPSRAVIATSSYHCRPP